MDKIETALAGIVNVGNNNVTVRIYFDLGGVVVFFEVPYELSKRWKCGVEKKSVVFVHESVVRDNRPRRLMPSLWDTCVLLPLSIYHFFFSFLFFLFREAFNYRFNPLYFNIQINTISHFIILKYN